MTASKLIISSRRESVTPFNAHAGIYLPFSNVDLGSGHWLLIANQCNRRSCEQRAGVLRKEKKKAGVQPQITGP